MILADTFSAPLPLMIRYFIFIDTPIRLRLIATYYYYADIDRPAPVHQKAIADIIAIDADTLPAIIDYFRHFRHYYYATLILLFHSALFSD
jgi:hypothetical protein